MSRTCPASQEWLGLVDGELSENRAAELRDHAAICRPCAVELEERRALVARIAAPVPGVPAAGALEAVMARLDAAELPPARRPWRFSFAAWGAAGLGAVATVGLALWLPRDAADRGTFAPRGEAVEWTRKVGVELWTIEGSLRRVTPGAAMAGGTPVVATYSNVDGAPAYLLAFALDRSNEVHWLYPAYPDPGVDPAAVRLEPSVVHQAFAETVVLEDLDPGPLRFVFVVSRDPLRVSSIEGLPPALREPDALRVRFPLARVDELTARVELPPAPHGGIR